MASYIVNITTFIKVHNCPSNQRLTMPRKERVVLQYNCMAPANSNTGISNSPLRNFELKTISLEFSLQSFTIGYFELLLFRTFSFPLRVRNSGGSTEITKTDEAWSAISKQRIDMARRSIESKTTRKVHHREQMNCYLFFT